MNGVAVHFKQEVQRYTDKINWLKHDINVAKGTVSEHGINAMRLERARQELELKQLLDYCEKRFSISDMIIVREGLENGNVQR
ncbi:hypothetical protein PBC5_008 [Bacillus phage PBC5]|nr:hypothetical protein PBC5_008 [Bacillus phage PBC5]